MSKLTYSHVERIAEFSRPCGQLPIVGLGRAPWGPGVWGVVVALAFVGAFVFGGGVR